MRKIGVTVPFLIVTVAVALSRTAANEKEEATKHTKLVGTWKMISAKWGGKEIKLPEGATSLKHITPTHFMRVRYDKDGKVLTALGGIYTVKGEVYEEVPEYGTGGFDRLKGNVQAFKRKVDGNKWYHSGKLSTGLAIEEVWERVKKD